jgi:hypothetical protein
MWLFLSFGFFSVVVYRDEPELLMVRARLLVDLEAMRSRMAAFPVITFYEVADYPYRMVVSRPALAAVLSREVEVMNATNFKGSIQDAERLRFYHEVWSTMKGLEGLEG